MSKKTILQIIFVITAIINFVLLFNFYYSSNTVIWLFVICGLVSSITIAFLVWILFKFIFLKTDKKFAEENAKENSNDAVSFFKKRQAPDGSYFQSVVIKENSLLSRIFYGTITILLIGTGIFQIILNNAHNLSPEKYTLGVLFVVAGIGGFLYNIYISSKNHDKINVGEYKQFKLYDDHFVLLPQNKALGFSEITYIQVFLLGESMVMNLFFENNSHYFFLDNGSDFEIDMNIASQSILKFLKYLGFEQNKYQLASDNNSAISNITTLVYNKLHKVEKIP
jgi:hypothetical protein